MNSLTSAEMTLMNVSQFVTTVQNMVVPVEDIYSNITALNKTIHLLEESANSSFSKIEMYYAMAVNRSRVVEALVQNATQAFASILDAENTTLLANSLASNFTSLISNLSSVDGILKPVQQWAYSISNGTDEADAEASVLSTNITQLSDQMSMINSTLTKLSNLTSALQLSTRQVLLAAEQQLEATRNLSVSWYVTCKHFLSSLLTLFSQEMANTALASALSLLTSVSMSSEEAANASDTLSSTQTTAQRLLGLPSLPTDEAVATARAINESIIPEQLVEELQADAMNSSSIANATLSKAKDAR